jgi:hypothetical protein
MTDKYHKLNEKSQQNIDNNVWWLLSSENLRQKIKKINKISWHFPQLKKSLNKNIYFHIDSKAQLKEMTFKLTNTLHNSSLYTQ